MRPPEFQSDLRLWQNQWQSEGLRGRAVTPGGHLQGRHFQPLTI